LRPGQRIGGTANYQGQIVTRAGTKSHGLQPGGGMMKRISFIFALLFLFGASGAAHAQTLSYADAIDQLAGACRGDLQRYCRGVELGGGHLKACLDAHQNVVSPQCQQTRANVYASIGRRIAAQRDIGDICSADIERLCGTSHADAHLVECLLSVSPAAISPQCNQAFTDTGWRTERAQR
jgi:hypothetical protein